ncbi:MAG: TolC family protein [Bacteroidota bacterium]
MAPLYVSSQSPILDAYIQQGLENNQSFLREQLGTKIQSQAVLEARGMYLPDISFDASYIWAGGGRNINVAAGDLVNPAYEGLNQLLGENRYPTDIPNFSEQFLPNDFHETKVRLIQPLLNTDIYYNYQAQKAQLSVQKAKQIALENQLVKQIKVAYYQYLSAQDQVVILKDTRQILEELVNVSRKQVANDKATKDIIYGAQVELSKLESTIAGAERQEQVARLFFNYLLSRDINEEIAREIEIGDQENAFEILNVLQESASSSRAELDQIKYGIEANRASILLNKNYIVPKINLVGDLGYQGFTYQFDDTQDFWFVQLSLSWPIFQGFQNKSKIQKSILQEKQLQTQLKETEDLITLEVAEAYYAYQEAEKIIQSRQFELQNAQENFRIIEKKYALGQAILVQYNEARNAFTTAQLQETIAKYNLKIKEAELESAIHFKN